MTIAGAEVTPTCAIQWAQKEAPAQWSLPGAMAPTYQEVST